MQLLLFPQTTARAGPPRDLTWSLRILVGATALDFQGLDANRVHTGLLAGAPEQGEFWEGTRADPAEGLQQTAPPTLEI